MRSRQFMRRVAARAVSGVFPKATPVQNRQQARQMISHPAALLGFTKQPNGGAGLIFHWFPNTTSFAPSCCPSASSAIREPLNASIPQAVTARRIVPVVSAMTSPSRAIARYCPSSCRVSAGIHVPGMRCPAMPWVAGRSPASSGNTECRISNTGCCQIGSNCTTAIRHSPSRQITGREIRNGSRRAIRQPARNTTDATAAPHCSSSLPWGMTLPMNHGARAMDATATTSANQLQNSSAGPSSPAAVNRRRRLRLRCKF